MTDDYDRLWAKVDSLEGEGLPRSAWDIVEQILDRARAENNEPQLLKALLHSAKYVAALEEQEINRIVAEMNAEIPRVSETGKAILHSVLGEILWRYYESSRYVLSDRTATSGLEDEDITTWDPRKIVSESFRHLELSTKRRDVLGATPVEQFLLLLHENGRDRSLRPTLFDFLAHRALQLFASAESGLPEPLRPFPFEDPRFMASAEEFVAFDIETPDSLSTDYHTARLYQELIRFHLDDSEPEALLDVDLARLAFVRRASRVVDRETAYVARLRQMHERYDDTAAGTAVTHALASTLASEGYRYDPLTSDRYKWLLKEAHELCATAVSRFPVSFGGEQCRVLQASIEEKSASFQVGAVVNPGQPFMVRLDYRNIDRVHTAVVRVGVDEMMRASLLSGKERTAFFESLTRRERISQQAFAVENDGDYQSHSTELPVEPVEMGLYALLVGSHPDFRTEREARGISFFAASHLGIVERPAPDGGITVRIVDRDSGEPLSFAMVKLWNVEYEDRQRQPRQVGSSVTDGNGIASLMRLSGGSFFLTVEHEGDQLVSMEWRHFGGRESKPSARNVTHFFTDRAIYRPGQRLYFKGVLLHHDGERYEIRPGARTTVRLRDPNRRELASLDLRANEFGTVHGTFDVPTGAGTGTMQIIDGAGAQTFSVEEYKRPRFEVTFDPVEGEVELGAEVRVKAHAIAFSGAPVDGATVKYRVTRAPVFRPWQYWWRIHPPKAEAEIASGVAETSADGSFTISFAARPDSDIPKSANPTFRYRVVADVTDFAGETRTGSADVRVGYTSLVLGIAGGEHWDRDSTRSVVVNTENVEGTFVGASGKLIVSRLGGPGRLLRDRLWPRVDRPLLSPGSFRDRFPLDPYGAENDPATWPVSEVVLDKAFDSQNSNEVSLDGIKTWPLGVYRVEAVSADAKGREVRSQRLVTLFSAVGERPPLETLDWFVPLVTSGEPGQAARLLVGSSAQDVRLFVEVEKRGRVVNRQEIRLSNAQQILEFPIDEDDRGDFAVHLSFVRHGRAVVRSQVVTVPYTNKQLTLKLETFRDQLYPGQDEEWRIRITGSKGEPVAAELLAAMYDASLDQFVGHDWDLSLYSRRWARLGWMATGEWGSRESTVSGEGWNRRFSARARSYDLLNWFGLDRFFGYQVHYMSDIREGVAAPMSNKMMGDAGQMEEEMRLVREDAPDSAEPASAAPAPAGPVRTDFNETAFFFPNLRTDPNGEVSLVFTIPEALTRWRMLGLAHTTDLRVGTAEATTVTKKDLMISANAPRFFREGDRLRFAAQVQNVSDDPLGGTARLEIYEMESMRPVNAEFGNEAPETQFSLAPGQSQGLRWSIRIPEGIGAVVYRVTADAGTQSDGEQKPLPVFTNRMLVTESLPLPMRGPGSRSFTFGKLKDNRSTTLRHHALTLEYSPNPVWYAVQALPYMMEFPHECSEQIFTRLYANSIAGHIVEQNPRIKTVFNQWRDLDADALQSNLEKNQELKSLVIEETPWLLAARNESERKRRIALLFDFARMDNERAVAVQKLVRAQARNGAWPWFDGMPPSRWITQHIVAGFGHMDRLGVFDPSGNRELAAALERAIAYMDREIKADYDALIERGADLNLRHLGWVQVHYLYARSYFAREPIPNESVPAFDYYMGQARRFWLDNDLYARGMIALALHRWGDEEIPGKVIRSLAENASHDDELGMYWKFNRGYYWYQAPIETQSLLIEAFDEIAGDSAAVTDMQLWLLKQKQTQDWKTTKATSEAVYALLMRGTNLIDEDSYVTITVGDETVDSRTVADAEAGTGYFTKSWEAADVTPDKSAVEVTKVGPGPAWGALFWQYFEQLDRITPAETPLSIEKRLFREELTDGGPLLKPLDQLSDVSTGDKITVRIIIRVDRDMEYVHLKDMRAAGFEPINVMSTYRYRGGLHYYESTRDAATHFFIGYLPKGTYVFEYPLRVNLAGDFSNGITSIQSMYAPEFASHSEGVRVEVVD